METETFGSGLVRYSRSGVAEHGRLICWENLRVFLTYAEPIQAFLSAVDLSSVCPLLRSA